MKIFVDADACPAAVKEIVVRAAERLAVSTIFFHHELREGGVVTGGPSGFGPREARAFAAVFDRELSRAMRG